jgi:hypothetical protein
MTPTEFFAYVEKLIAESTVNEPWALDHCGQLDVPRTAGNRMFVNASRTVLPATVKAR